MLDPDVGREAARQLARDELRDPGYAEAQPSLVVRALAKAVEKVQELFDRASAHTPGGRLGLVLVLVVLVVLVVVLLAQLRVGRRGPQGGALFTGGTVLTAADHRAAAQAHADAGAWDEAVRERLRAVVRDLEARGVLDARPGRTADEVAGEAGRLVPSLGAPLRRAATTFDEVWYGGREAGPDAYAVLVEVDDLVASTRMVLT